MAPRKLKWLDIASMSLSGLCVVHCLALPVLAALVPFLSVFTDNSWVHPLIFVIAAPLSIIAIATSNAWKKWQVSLPITGGLVLLALAAFVPALSGFDTALTVTGALMIAAAHLTNYLGHRLLHLHAATCGQCATGD
ncbi:MAG: MerC domain-containing protein [Asticcacaulis sp.]